MAKRIIRVVGLILLVLSLISILLVLRKPAVAGVETSADASRSFDEKMARLVQAQEQRLPGEIRLTEAEINSKIQEGLRDNPPPTGAVTLKGATVRLEGEKLLTMLTVNAKGINLYVTVGGSLGFSNHIVRVIPSEVRVGSLPVPVSWLAGKIDMHMEVPGAVTGMRIENSELVVQAQ
jgi:hypothetical protein